MTRLERKDTWARKIKGTAYIYTNQSIPGGRAIVQNTHGIWFDGIEYPTLEAAKDTAAALRGEIECNDDDDWRK